MLTQKRHALYDLGDAIWPVEYVKTLHDGVYETSHNTFIAVYCRFSD